MKTVSLTEAMVYKGNLILVNREHPYRGELENMWNHMESIRTANNILLERHAATAYTKIMDELCSWEKITAVSGWRSMQEQERIYRNSLAEHGADFTAKYVALPGHSEHQTGLALDLALNQPEIDALRPHFPYTGICGDFRTTAERLGFIERYPKGKEGITGIAHEPWHFRHVGAPHAMLMGQTGETLEEYIARLKRFPHGSKPLRYDFGDKVVEISYLAAGKKTTEFAVEDDSVYTVSGNNMDGFIITIWRNMD